MAEIGLGAEIRTAFEHPADVIFLYEIIFRGGFLDGLAAQTDIYCLPPPDKLGVVAQEKCETGN